jgi:hypothetical protein
LLSGEPLSPALSSHPAVPTFPVEHSATSSKPVPPFPLF